jgi:hypothetical protein
MPAVGEPPQKPTSFNWSVTLLGPMAWLLGWTEGDDPQPIITSTLTGIADLTERWWNGQLKYECSFDMQNNVIIDGFGSPYDVFSVFGVGVEKNSLGECVFGMGVYTYWDDPNNFNPCNAIWNIRPLSGSGGISVTPENLFGTHSFSYTINYYLCGFEEPPFIYQSWQVGASITIS